MNFTHILFIFFSKKSVDSFKFSFFPSHVSQPAHAQQRRTFKITCKQYRIKKTNHCHCQAQCSFAKPTRTVHCLLTGLKPGEHEWEPHTKQRSVLNHPNDHNTKNVFQNINNTSHRNDNDQ